MTPSQLEHLRLLKAHLETLIENASKRTPGEWLVKYGTNNGWDIESSIGPHRVAVEAWHDGMRNQDEYTANGTYIASCAGNAEAGWRSALAAIEWTIWLAQDGLTGLPDKVLESILAAWPIETLKP